MHLAGRDLPLMIRRHPRAKQLTLRLAPDGTEIRLTIPRWGSTSDAVDFARSRAEWLERQLHRIPPASPPIPGGTLHFRGRPLRIDWAPDHPRIIALSDKALRLGGTREALTGRLQRWLEKQALTLLQQDLSDYCEAAGLDTPDLRLSKAQRRWGSCAADGTIRINWRLVQAPDHVRRSVVAHEVAHLVHFDHSADFHALLAEIYGNGLDVAEQWLKSSGRTLYTQFG
nr:SprT family zinc-dependent metalloprotease [Altericroceibacterium endophyticum]